MNIPTATKSCRRIARGVIGDYREPHILRLGFTPLYTRHFDVWDSAEVLRDVLATSSWRAPEFAERATWDDFAYATREEPVPYVSRRAAALLWVRKLIPTRKSSSTSSRRHWLRARTTSL
jgi:hypothetical protein